MLGSCINVSQKNNLVIIKINENAKIQDIIPQIKKKVYQLKKIYKGEKTPIKIIGKVLKNKQNDYKDIIKFAKRFETSLVIGMTTEEQIINNIKSVGDCDE